MEDSVKELWMMVPWWGGGLNIINIHISYINTWQNVSTTAQAMLGGHFTPIDKQVYLYFSKGGYYITDILTLFIKFEYVVLHTIRNFGKNVLVQDVNSLQPYLTDAGC